MDRSRDDLITSLIAYLTLLSIKVHERGWSFHRRMMVSFELALSDRKHRWWPARGRSLCAVCSSAEPCSLATSWPSSATSCRCVESYKNQFQSQDIISFFQNYLISYMNECRVSKWGEIGREENLEKADKEHITEMSSRTTSEKHEMNEIFYGRRISMAPLGQWFFYRIHHHMISRIQLSQALKRQLSFLSAPAVTQQGGQRGRRLRRGLHRLYAPVQVRIRIIVAEV